MEEKKSHIYTPQLMTITKIIQETPDVRTFRLEFKDKEFAKTFSFKPGQFGELSVLGVGECTFGISSSPLEKEYIEFSVKMIGRVTKVLHTLEEGSTVGFRGPYGNWFPYDTAMKDKNLVFIGGGIGMAPLRSLFYYVLGNRSDYKDITVLVGARSISDHSYKREIVEEWETRTDINFVKTIDFDPGKVDPPWTGKIGFVPTVLEQISPSKENAVTIICGPPIMIKFSCNVLLKLGFAPEQIISTLEMKMKCGLGKCGRCNIGKTYVCKEGPVFSYAELLALPAEY